MIASQFPTNLFRKRKAAGLTQKALAGLCQTSKVSISNYETGKSFPGEVSLRRICQKLNCTATDLLGF